MAQNYEDDEIIGKVINIFISEGSRAVKELAAALKNGDSKQVVFNAHKIKGSARHVAAGKLSEVAEIIEYSARKEDLVTADSHFDQLKSEFKSVRSCLSRSKWARTSQQKQKNGENREASDE